MKFLPKFRGDFDLDRRSRARSRGRSGERLLGRRSPLVSILPMTLFRHHKYYLILIFENNLKCVRQAVGALGELSDKSDFSLLAWDSFSQEIRDLFTVVRSITYILLSKLFEFT